MDRPSYLGRWSTLREVILSALGILLIAHAVFGNGSIDRVFELVIGLILLGVVPIDVFADRILGHIKPKEPPSQ